jgi:hypothetical protein
MNADLYAQIQHAIWEGRWLALLTIWNALLAHPWTLIAVLVALALKGKRAVFQLARLVGLTWWHHAQD